MTEAPYMHRKAPPADDSTEKAPVKASPSTAPATAAAQPLTAPATAQPATASTPVAPASTAPAAPAAAPAPATEPAKTATPQPPAKPNTVNPDSVSPTTPLHWVLIGVITALALWLRAREALSSGIVGAEDPYLHIERTWALVRGDFTQGYPIGFALLLAPFTLLGPDGFYTFARVVPPLFGAASVFGIFLLARRYMAPTAAAGAALFVAVMPEHIIRTNLLFPTALDLAIFPFLVWAFLSALDGNKRALHAGIILAFVLLLAHPWFIALCIPAFAIVAAIRLLPRPRARAYTAAGIAGSFVLLLGFAYVLPGVSPAPRVAAHAVPLLSQLVVQPGSIMPLPQFVDYPAMVTWPILLLAIGGAFIALVRRTPLSIFAFVWALTLVPLTLVDWLDMGYVPHRVVAFLTPALALLAALPLVEAERALRNPAKNTPSPVTFGAIALLGLLLVPTAMAVPPWYRVYQETDFQAAEEISARDPSLVVSASWQFRAGYVSRTGHEAVYNPSFFEEERVRTNDVYYHPDLVVVIDRHSRDANVTTDFLASWTKIGTWQDVEAYVRA